jgi:hypothetical protein
MHPDRREAAPMLHDFSFQTPDGLLAGLTQANQSAIPKSGMSNNMDMEMG